MNREDSITDGRTAPAGDSRQPAGIESGEIVYENQDAPVSNPEARMAESEAEGPPLGGLTRPTTGDIRWVTAIALWAPLIFMLILVFLAFRGQHLRDTDAQRVLHTVQVKNQLDRINILVTNAETNQRGYLLTGDASFLALYEKALGEIPGQSQNLVKLIADNPKQVAAAAHLQILIASRLSISAQSVSLAQQGRFPDAIQIVKQGEGTRLMDEIRSQVDAMEAEEDRLLPLRESVLASQVRTQKYEMSGLVAVEIALIAGLIFLMQRMRILQLTADERIEQANVTTDQAQASTFKAMARTEQAEVQMADAKAKTEQAEASTSLLSICVSHLNDIVLITKADSIEEPGPRIAFVNEAFERMTGYTSAEALGRSPRFLQGPKTDRHVLDEIHQAVALQKPIRRQIVNYRKDGTEFWLDIDIVPVFDGTSKCTHFVGIERDVSDQVRLEEALRDSDIKFRLLAENITDVFWIASPDLEKMYYVSPAYTLIWGRSPESLYAHPHEWIEAILPEDRERFMVVFAKLRQKEPSVSVEYRIARPDGSVRWVHHRGFRVLNAKDELTHLTGLVTDITEPEREQNVSRETEKRYRTLFDYAPDGILIISPENIYIDANVGMCKMLGYTRDELIGQRVTDIVAETNRLRMDPVARVIQGKLDHHREWKFLRKDGSTCDIDAISTVMPDGNVLAMIRDVTERNHAEERSRRQQTELRILFDLMPALVWFKDTENNILRVNKRVAEAAGKSVEEMEGKPALEIYPHQVSKSYADDLEVIRSGAPKLGIVETIQGREGEELWIQTDKVPYRDQEGKVVGIVVTAQDITERRHATEQIAEQAALLDEAQDAIILQCLEGKVIFWNKGAERMYGWTRQEVLGVYLSGILFARPKQFAEVTALTISKGEWSGDLQHLTKDKREITVEARWTLIRDDKGQPKSVLAINTDVTQKKKTEAQFMRAQRMESIGTLAGGIAHDLNNILAPIMMSIDILKLTATNPEAMSILDTIEVSSKRGSDIVRQVLSFARGIEGERVEIQPAHLLKELESIVKNTFPKNIRLQFAIPNDTWLVLGDPTQVHQILLNLCVNARDAMPNGGNLTFGVENCVLDENYAAMHIEAKAGRYVTITVTDTGTGIPQEIIEKIFEPFFTTKEINEGTGLGLSTVVAIVKSHEGIINVYSELGKGTTFKVYLPAVKLSAEAQKLVTRQISVPRGKGETVLVVDDEASILTITSQTLQAFGYRVLTATDGAEAVAVFAKHENEIDIVLTDMSMPIMDGAAVIRALTKISPAVKIIAASGLDANGEAAKVSGLAVKHFLTKPYTAGTLLKKMRMILDEVQTV